MAGIISDEYQRFKGRFRLVIWIVIILLLTVLGFYMYGKLRGPSVPDNQSAAELLHKLDSVSNLAKTFENANGKLVTDNIALVAKNDGILREMSATVFNLKSDQEKLVKQVNYLTLIKQQIRYDSVFIRYDSTRRIPLIAEGRSDSIGVPQSFSFADTLSGVYGRVLKSGVSLDSVWVNNNIWLRHGVRKKGFLNLGREDFVEAMNTNPMVRTTGLGTVTYHPKPSAWNRWIKPLAAAVVGAGLTYAVMK